MVPVLSCKFWSPLIRVPSIIYGLLKRRFPVDQHVADSRLSIGLQVDQRFNRTYRSLFIFNRLFNDEPDNKRIEHENSSKLLSQWDAK